MFRSTPQSQSPIQDWLVERVADYTDRAAHQVDPSIPLAELGMDSVSAVSLCGEIEDRWYVEIDPTLVFDYPTITAIAGFLADEFAVAA
ncbi:acyl carrier protein [Nocardia sp. NPDC050717]|uniref:acyl carrier protein n=1 Tax=Nocardia sp. NPDC050717 TaxID=3157221 RepID=UPI0033CC2BDB